MYQVGKMNLYKYINDDEIIFIDETSMYFGRGKFDNYAVMYKELDGSIELWTDDVYFAKIKKYSKELSKEKIWKDFSTIANKTSYIFDKNIIRMINELSYDYPNSLDTFKTYCILYMAMISEECKEHSVLGKRIKMLGVYNTIIDGYPIKYIVKYMRGKPVQYLQELCIERGI